MLRVADFCFRRRRLVLALWVVALIVFVAIGSAVKAEHRANYRTPGAESSKAYDLLGAKFPVRKGDSIKLVFAGNLDDPSVRARVGSVVSTVEHRPHVAAVDSPFADGNGSQISASGRVAYAEVHFDERLDQLQNGDGDFQQKFLAAVPTGTHHGLDIEVTAFTGAVKPGSEFAGLVFAAIILVVAFGSVLAMGLPILMAVFGLGIGTVLGGVLSRLVETPDWAATVALMIGLGVGIDYALFIITRYRVSLHSGLTPREANITAMGTSGRAVMYAGATVVISLLGMLTMGLSYLHGVAGSAVLAVLSVLAASLTLLPALLGFVGANIDKWRVPGTGRPSHQGDRAFWYRWSRVVQRRPWTAFFGAAVVLAILTLPLFSLRLGFPDDGNNPASYTSRKAYDLLTTGFGPGFNGPLLVVVDAGDAGADGAASAVSDVVRKTKDVAFVAEPVLNQARDTAIVTVFPKTKPQDEATVGLVHQLRDSVLPAVERETGAKTFVGGFTAISIDQSNYVSNRLPLFIGAVVLLSFVLLTAVFRSPLVAFKAGIMNLLSIAGAYGVMAYAVHGGWFGSLLGINETPVPAFIPMINFAILFGLSMDYEVFLLSRIREEYLHTHDNGTAVADGLANTARVITAAALIMAFVFGVFIFDPNTFIKQIGVGLTAAVLIDATIVRMVLVPATMELLGDANWWIPRWLDRLLPEIHIEGDAAVEAELATIVAAEEKARV